MSGKIRESFLMLRHFLDHLRQVLDAFAVRLDPLLLIELLKLLRHVLRHDGDVLFKLSGRHNFVTNISETNSLISILLITRDQ